MIRQTVVEFCKLFGWYFCGYFFFVGSWVHVYDLTHFIETFERQPEQKKQKRGKREEEESMQKREFEFSAEKQMYTRERERNTKKYK